MSIDALVENLTPWQFATFKYRNPVNRRCCLRTPWIRVAIFDSAVAVAADGFPKIAAMIVPENRETDWKFCSQSGHLQLLFNNPTLSRLILIGNDLPPNQHPCIYTRPPVTDTAGADRKKLEDELQTLVISLHPKVCFLKGLPKPQFLAYEDDVLYRSVIATFEGPVVGEFVVEDVLLECYDDGVDKKLRRNLRFKRTPNLIQSQVLLYPVTNDDIVPVLNLENLKKMKNAKFEVDTTVLVHSYLTPMVFGLFVIGAHLHERIQQGFTPRALCLGVGGGALLSFLNSKLGFEVVGVEADEVVLNAAKQFFGLNNGNYVQLIVGDAIDVIQNFPLQQQTKENTDDSDSEVKNDGFEAKFDVVMVDLDSSEGQYGPPEEFVKKSVFQAVSLLLDDQGIFIINVDPLNDVFSKNLVQELKDAFHKVYQIDVDEEYNFVVMAIKSPPNSTSGYEYYFLEKLRCLLFVDYIESIIEL